MNSQAMRAIESRCSAGAGTARSTASRTKACFYKGRRSAARPWAGCGHASSVSRSAELDEGMLDSSRADPLATTLSPYRKHSPSGSAVEDRRDETAEADSSAVSGICRAVFEVLKVGRGRRHRSRHLLTMSPVDVAWLARLHPRATIGRPRCRAAKAVTAGMSGGIRRRSSLRMPPGRADISI